MSRSGQSGAQDYVAGGIRENDRAEIQNICRVEEGSSQFKTAMGVGGVSLDNAAVQKEEEVVGGRKPAGRQAKARGFGVGVNAEGGGDVVCAQVALDEVL